MVLDVGGRLAPSAARASFDLTIGVAERPPDFVGHVYRVLATAYDHRGSTSYRTAKNSFAPFLSTVGADRYLHSLS